MAVCRTQCARISHRIRPVEDCRVTLLQQANTVVCIGHLYRPILGNNLHDLYFHLISDCTLMRGPLRGVTLRRRLYDKNIDRSAHIVCAFEAKLSYLV